MNTLAWWARRCRARRALRRAEQAMLNGWTPAREVTWQLARINLRRVDLNRP